MDVLAKNMVLTSLDMDTLCFSSVVVKCWSTLKTTEQQKSCGLDVLMRKCHHSLHPQSGE